MRTRWSGVGLLATAASVLLVLCSRDDTVFNADDAREFTSSVTGRVVDRRGDALAGALVTARPTGVTTVSGADGGFTLSELRAGSHVLSVTLVDYRDTASDSIRLGLDEELVLDSTLRLTYRYGWIRGTVSVQGQQPVPLDAGLQVEYQQANGRTYPNGSYLLHRVEPGTVKLFAAMRDVGYGTAQLAVTPEDTADADVLIDRQGGTVSGTILDSTGQPVPNAVVSAVGDILADTTDSAGTYTLTEVPSEGDVCLTVTTATGRMSVAGISVTEGGHTDMPDLRVSAETSPGSVSLAPAVVFATEADTAIIVVMNAILEDTASRIAAYSWDTDNDGSWDSTTATSRLALPPRSAGQYTVLVQCMTTDSQFSAIVPVSITVAAVTTNNPPQFTHTDSAMTPTAYQGMEYVDTVHAVDPDGDVVRLYFIDSLPSSFILADSIVRWTPQDDSGTQTVRIVADDEQGGRDTLTWSITVMPPLQGIQITTQMPPTIYGRELDTITLFIHAQGAPPLHYRWFHKGVAVGEDTSVYIIDTIRKADAGWYRVQVWNAVDSVWSDSAELVVDPPMNDGPWQPQSPQELVHDTNGLVEIKAAGYWFDMGQAGIPGAEPVHQVNFTRDFWMDTIEVTQQEYISMMGVYPFVNQKFDDHPAENVTWFDAILFCNARSVRDGYDTVYSYSRINGMRGDGCTLEELRYLPDRNGYRLPTEAEWEYACRGGTQTDYYWEPDTIQKYAWFNDNSGGTTHMAAGLAANQYGLHDMSGNVAEWCFDMYGTYPMSSPSDPIGPDSGSTKVVRGGAYGDIPSSLASAARLQAAPDHRDGTIGFRCVRQEAPVDAPPVILGQPMPTINLFEGDTLVMFVMVSGTPPLAYEWYKDSMVVGTDAEYRVGPVDASHAGNYWVYISNPYGGTTSAMSVVTVSPGGSAQPWQPTGALDYDRGAVRVHAAGYSFMMGQAGEQDAEPVHLVEFTRDFWMDTVEVTQSEYMQLMGINPSAYFDTAGPVMQMSWFDAVLFCNARSKRDSLDTVYTFTSYSGTFGNGVTVLEAFGFDFSKNGYRLPTEAEWEYACRGGTNTRFFWGDDSLLAAVGTYALYVENAGPYPGQVGLKESNAYGLRDMTGNVLEYCHDFYDPNYYQISPLTDPMGPPSSPTGIVIRGGCHSDAVSELASARRTLLDPGSYAGVSVGIRCARTIP